MSRRTHPNQEESSNLGVHVEMLTSMTRFDAKSSWTGVKVAAHFRTLPANVSLT